MELIDLDKDADIKTMRRMRQCTTSAYQCLDNGDFIAYQEWMTKALCKHNELRKNLGLEEFVSVPGTTKQIVSLGGNIND